MPDITHMRHNHDLALLGVALLAAGGGSLGAGSAVPAHLICTIVAWAVAAACFTLAHRRYAHS